MRLALAGHGASRGLALGRARLRDPHAMDSREQTIEPDEVEAEVARLHTAIAAARAELLALRERLHGALAHELGEFIDIHALILDDPELLHGLDALVRTGRYRAEYALKLQRDKLVLVFEGMDDPYFRSRREDIEHVVRRVRTALHRGSDTPRPGIAGDILVTDSVGPADLVQLQAQGVVAIVTSSGSTLSHAAILARSVHMPLLIGVHDVLERIDDGDTLMVDGSAGEVIRDPDADDLRRYRQREQGLQREQRTLQKLRQADTRTRDGIDIRLYANAESREDVAEAHALGATGIGLYRTEFLFLQRPQLPDENEQFRAYRDLVLGMSGRPVTIRTLDLGADKADRSGVVLSNEPNPALGLRGVRLSLARRDLFDTQLRAILRASGYGAVRILVPMVSRREELVAVRALVHEHARDLRTEGHEIADHIDLGAMIEVPAAALALRDVVDLVDFLSIGTNDLMQYLLAADRDNEAIADVYSPLHPAFIHLLREVIVAGQRSGLPVAVCGEMAGDVRYTRLLLALGLTDFSLHPSSLLEVRQIVRETDLGKLHARSRSLLRARDREQLEAWLTDRPPPRHAARTRKRGGDTSSHA
ncbi:MAG: phosphoenolpyruvate--protein phosphotransferase [Proteobacteria bacterium]|nr:phosphoenolpyruvate--protein phosphotransferase [Pseudomonadota bacterium]